ncbi:MAG: hypothetical protein AAFV53_31980 [Myxococcota bacterium]
MKFLSPAVLGALNWTMVAVLPSTDALRVWIGTGSLNASPVLQLIAHTPRDALAGLPWFALGMSTAGLAVFAVAVLRHIHGHFRRQALAIAGVLTFNLAPAVLPSWATGVLQSSPLPCTELPCLIAERGIDVAPGAPLRRVQVWIDDRHHQIEVELDLETTDAYPFCPRAGQLTLSVAGQLLEQTSVGGTADRGRFCQPAVWIGPYTLGPTTRSLPLILSSWTARTTWTGVTVPSARPLERLPAEEGTVTLRSTWGELLLFWLRGPDGPVAVRISWGDDGERSFRLADAGVPEGLTSAEVSMRQLVRSDPHEVTADVIVVLAPQPLPTMSP